VTGPILSPLTLGTVQFGSAYGIVNDHGCPDDEEICRILDTAEKAGISYLDTAAAYGAAEERLGRLLTDGRGRLWGKVTKLPPLADAADNPEDLRRAVVEFMARSRERLRSEFIEIVMFHRSDDMFRHGGVALDALEAEVEAKRVGAIGVSIYNPDEAVRCLTDRRISHLQLPLNIMDGRWMEKPFSQVIRNRPDTTIHARSAFLQGLLLSPAERWPDWVENRSAIETAIDRSVDALGCRNRIDLCLTYTHSVPWVRTTVIGVDSQQQLQMIVLSFSGRKFSGDEMTMLSTLSTLAPPRLLNPALW